MNWTNKEIKFLEDNYPKYGISFCVEKLNRTKRSIQLKRRKLGIESKYPVKPKWRKENLVKVVKESNNYVECLKKLGIKNFGSSFNTLKKYIELYNINIEHFISPGEQIRKLSKEIPINEVLIENSSYNRTRLKERLYKEGLKERKCELCAQNEIWMDKKMSLILDHINGVNNDNRIENLRIVCPNCNATLDTHCVGSKITKKKEKRSKNIT